MNVYEAMTAVMRSVGAVAKKDQNTFHRFNFRGIDATVNALSPAFREHGVTVRPGEVLSCEYEKFQTAKGGVSITCRLIVRYVFTGPEGDSVDAVVAAEAADTGDKATPKAMSVAFRTALLQTFALPTDEVDPDAHSYEHQRDWLADAQKLSDADAVLTLYYEAQRAGASQSMLEQVAAIGKALKEGK